MDSLAGTIWRVIEVRGGAAADAEPQPLGPHPVGLVMFEAERMMGVVADGRVSLPPGEASRFFVAYAGGYRFDGVELVVRVDEASRPELMIEQVRRLRFESDTRMMAVPVAGLPEQAGIEVVWERVG